MRAISVTWNLRDSRNCASSGGMDSWVNLAPLSRTTVSCALAIPDVLAFHRDWRILACSSFSRCSVCGTPVASNPELNIFPPNVSAAIASPTPSARHGLGDPQMPSYPKPGMWAGHRR